MEVMMGIRLRYEARAGSALRRQRVCGVEEEWVPDCGMRQRGLLQHSDARSGGRCLGPGATSLGPCQWAGA
jgi:hypothetical protein